jgi:hypothetical protein
MIFFCGSVYFGQLINAKLKKRCLFFQSQSLDHDRLRNPVLGNRSMVSAAMNVAVIF